MGILYLRRDPPPNPFELETRGQNRHWVVAVRGEIDLATVGTLEAELARLQGKPIFLDLSEVSFIDSMGLTLLIRTAGRVTIGSSSAAVDSLIRTCGLESELRFARSQM